MAKISSFYDLFDGDSLDLVKWTVLGGIPSVSSGNLDLTDHGTDGYAEIAGSDQTYDLSDSEVRIHITRPGDQFTFSFQSATPGAGWAEFDLYAGDPVLYGAVVDNDNSLNLFPRETFDPDAMKWLRIRASGDSVFLEYSADGESWTELYDGINDYGHSDFFPPSLTSGYIVIGDSSSADGLLVDRINNPPTSSLVDDFTGTTLDEKWMDWGTDASVSGGDLVIAPDNNDVVSSTEVDFDLDSITVHWDDFADCGAIVFISDYGNTNNPAVIMGMDLDTDGSFPTFVQGVVEGIAGSNGVMTTQTEATGKWWKIALDGDAIHFYQGSDGILWEELLDSPVAVSGSDYGPFTNGAVFVASGWGYVGTRDVRLDSINVNAAVRVPRIAATNFQNPGIF